MKKKDIKKIAIVGLSTGLILAAQTQLAAENNTNALSMANEALAAKCGGNGSENMMRKCGASCGGMMRKCGASCGGMMRKCGASCGGMMRKCGGSCGGMMRKCGGSCGGLTADADTKTNPSSAMPLPKQANEYKDDKGGNSGNMGYHLMTEDELMMELDSKGQDLYKKLDQKGKELARYVASQRCNGTNMCAGLNACATDSNKCAGQGSCKGTGKCAFADKNQAVKVVSEKMAKKRNNASP